MTTNRNHQEAIGRRFILPGRRGAACGRRGDHNEQRHFIRFCSDLSPVRLAKKNDDDLPSGASRRANNPLPPACFGGVCDCASRRRGATTGGK